MRCEVLLFWTVYIHTKVEGNTTHMVVNTWYILIAIPGENVSAQTLSPELDLERCLETVSSLCSSRAHVCETVLYFTAFLSAENCWESGLT